MKTHIENLVSFIAAQMDGEPVAPAGSAAISQLSAAVQALQAAPDSDLQVLALRTIGAVVDRVRSNIAAEQTLHAFIRGGDRA